ncbi:MAG TPA: PQQ-binding-like beta-propeller repeat protein [Acidimicrobiia bacterium]|nr:PQQ-binding-like beta-propeller repeat protein [Acidimicrobiia bacterium]
MTRPSPRRRVLLGAAGLAVLAAAGAALTATGGGEPDAGAAQARARARVLATAAPAPAPGPARWSALTAGGEPMGVTADAAGVVVVSYGSVQSLDPADGSERWRARIGRTPDIAPVRAAVDADLVAVPTSSGVTALARADGALRWTARFGPGLADAGITGPVALAQPAGGEPLVLGTNSGTLTAFDRGSGATRWSVRFDGEIVTAPVVDGTAGVTVALWHVDGGEGRLRAVDLATGTVRWDVATLEKTAAPVAHGGVVLVSEGDNFSHARVRALDSATGASRWETAVPKSFEWETEPAAAGDDYVTVDHFGTVTAFSVTTGTIRWQRSGDWALIDTQVVIGARSVAFHDFAGHQVVLDRATGEVRSVTRAGPVTDEAVRDDLVVTAVNEPVARRFEARPLP